jgi:hypothetical protein
LTPVTVIFIESAGFWVVMYQWCEARVKSITSVCCSIVATSVWLGTQSVICNWSEIEIEVFCILRRQHYLIQNAVVAHVSAIIQ